MADALCGPSNALQNFQKHTSSDRTLQQDRLIGDRRPAEGFRSTYAYNDTVDREFEAFQIERPNVLPSIANEQFHLSRHLAQPSHNAIPAHAPSLDGWADTFQQLHIGAPKIRNERQSHAPAAGPSSWHEEFARQQMPLARASPVQQQQRPMLSSPRGLGFQQGMNHMRSMSSGTPMEAHNISIAGREMPVADEAAFEQAFALVDQEMQTHLDAAMGSQAVQPSSSEDAAWVRIREQRPACYAALKVQNALDLGQMNEAARYMDDLESLESMHGLVEDASEAKWLIDTLKRTMSRELPQAMTTRIDRLVGATNQRLMSTYPFQSMHGAIDQSKIWEELAAAGYTPPTTLEPAAEANVTSDVQDQQQQEEKISTPHNDDEMAETAGRLLESVADNTSEKFQKSHFFELMRRFRDREVVVQGEHVVDVGATAQVGNAHASRSQQNGAQSGDSSHYDNSHAAYVPDATIPPIDPNILDHADTDFVIPSYPEDLSIQHQQQYAPSSLLPGGDARKARDAPYTDEISGQYRYYNTRAAYHYLTASPGPRR